MSAAKGSQMMWRVEFRARSREFGGTGACEEPASPPASPLASPQAYRAGDLRQPPSPEVTEAIAAAQGGDEDAFRVLYHDVQPRLLRYLRGLVGDDADDVAAEAWVQIARNLQTFRGDADGFRGWAATIARHRALDHLRRQSRRPVADVPVEELTGVASHGDTVAEAFETLSTDWAIALISRLPRDQAEAVLLRVVMGLDAKSAGKVLGKRAGAVRTAAYRGLRRLGEMLADANGGDDLSGP